MNRIFLSLIPVAAVWTALGQTPAAPPAPPSNIVTETGRIARVLAGPGDRPQGFLLRNGTFVMLPPGLSQRMPSTLSTNTSIRVAGDEFTYGDSRTIHAQRILLAGISYDDAPPAIPAPPPPPAAPRTARSSVPPPCPSAGDPTRPAAPPAPPMVRTQPTPPAAPPPPPAR